MENGNRGVGGKRCSRRSVSISNDYDSKLSKLAVACGMAPATLASLLLQLCLDSPNTVNYLQDKYNRNPQYRVYPIRENNKVTY